MKSKVSDAVILEAYQRLKSVHRVGKEVGLNHSTVHERLVKMGQSTPPPLFTAAERAMLLRDYPRAAETGTLDELAKEMGRSKTSLARIARTLGLTKPNRSKPYLATWKYMPREVAVTYFEEFKSSSLGLKAWCTMKGLDDLGFWKTMKKYFSDEWDHVIELKTPKQSKYRLGRAVEYRVRDALKVLGYFVMRSPASRSPIDLVAIRNGEVRFIQCKRSLSLGVKEWNELFELAESVGASAILAGTPTGRGTVYYKLVGKKDGSHRAQPFEPWLPV